WPGAPNVQYRKPGGSSFTADVRIAIWRLNLTSSAARAGTWNSANSFKSMAGNSGVDEDRCATGHRQIRAGGLLTRQVLMEADLDRQCTLARPCYSITSLALRSKAADIPSPGVLAIELWACMA